MHPYFSQALADEHIRDARSRAASARRAKEAIAARGAQAPAAGRKAHRVALTRTAPVRRLVRGA